MTQGRAVLFFCADPARDPVASHVFEASRRLLPLVETGDEVDGMPVLAHRDAAGREFVYVRTAEVLSHDYPRYLPLLTGRLSGFDVALLVNWHEGANAPDGIFMAHTTGDVVSGRFGPADPALTTAVLRAIERTRTEAGLDRYRTVTEATHWSGVVYGHAPELLTCYPVPLLDVEIGSSPESWSDPEAAEVLARALVRIFDEEPPRGGSVLFVGGVHFEPSIRDAVLGDDRPDDVAVSHVLANHWLVAGGYGEPGGAEKLEACCRSIAGGVDALVFHDNLKGALKATVRAVAERLWIPSFNHRRLRSPEPLPLRAPADPTG
ncbi:MAG TPA: D-aminoacyl-tRNA deacylase [Longimicrobiaceae bacterium]|nr:D-aminoacyl-tRNA deacylase [Longimicrobiaceae bacterium]